MSQAPTAKAWLNQRLHPHKKLLHLATLLGLAAHAAFAWQCWLLAWLLGPLVLGTSPNLSLLGWLPLAMGLRLLLAASKDWLGGHVSLSIRQQLRQELMSRISQLGLARRQAGPDGSLASQVLEQVDAMDAFFSRYFSQLRLVILVPLMMALLIGMISPLVVAIMLLSAPMIPIAMILVGRRAAQANRQQFKALSHLGGQFLDRIRGLSHLRLMGASQQAAVQLAGSSEEYRSRTMKVLQQAFLSTAVLELFASLAIAMVALYLGLGLLGELPWAKGQVPVALPLALFVLMLTPEFYQPLRQLGSDYHAKAQAEGAAESLISILQQPLPQSGCQQVTAQPQTPALCFQAFSLAGQGRLQQLDLRLEPGERVAVLGASGAGKTSLLQAILGHQQAESGQLLIYGTDSKTVDWQHWRQQLSWLAQKPDWFSGSLADNLRLAQPQASDDELWQALDQVGAQALVQALPKGLDSHLGEGGLGLSGGQLQRLALARLLLKPAAMWLLDEPGAHLDPSSRLQIQQLIAKHSQGKTLVYVTHDRQGLEWFDRLIVLKQGRILAQCQKQGQERVDFLSRLDWQ